jgi:hypothetical protein
LRAVDIVPVCPVPQDKALFLSHNGCRDIPHANIGDCVGSETAIVLPVDVSYIHRPDQDLAGFGQTDPEDVAIRTEARIAHFHIAVAVIDRRISGNPGDLNHRELRPGLPLSLNGNFNKVNVEIREILPLDEALFSAPAFGVLRCGVVSTPYGKNGNE